MTKLALAVPALLAALAAAPHDARANAACYSNNGWAPGIDATLPTHAKVIYYDDNDRGSAPKLVATLGGKAVNVKTTITHVAPYRFFTIEIDSDRTGKLELSVDGDDAATFTVKSDVKLPKESKGTAARFHQAHSHSTVHEMFDGLAIHLDDKVDAITAHVKIRRDDKAKWSELDVPVGTDAGHPAVLIGELGCTKNYEVALLEGGVDLEITLTLTDGSTIPVKELSSHVVLQKDASLPKSRP